MRTVRILFFVVAASMMLSVSAWASTDLINSPHDLSITSTNGGIHTDAANGSDQTCVFCHTPHAAVASTYGPLWNRNYTPGAFTYYTSATFDGDNVTPLVLGAQSYACMSCHDGTLALDNLANTPGSGTIAWAAGGIYTFVGANLDANNTLNGGVALVGTDLSNDHPVGFVYADSSTADAQINPAPAAYPLYAGNMECATCHNVHDYDGGGVGASAGFTMFLRGDTAQSAICTGCHAK